MKEGLGDAGIAYGDTFLNIYECGLGPNKIEYIPFDILRNNPTVKEIKIYRKNEEKTYYPIYSMVKRNDSDASLHNFLITRMSDMRPFILKKNKDKFFL